MKKAALFAPFAAAFLLFAGCQNSPPRSASVSSPASSSAPALRIVSGSENQTLEPLIQEFARKKGASIQVDYLGSVDIMLQLQSADLPYDAAWPANSLWIRLGDSKKRVKYEKSIMRSPVVFGVKRSVASRLGWIGKKVKVEDILKAAESGRLRYMMTSATQSNSGASAYLGYLCAFTGKHEALTDADLKKPHVREKIKRILGTVNRSSGSSGWLKDLFLKKYENYDAMVNYESLVIEANQELAREGKEPLYAIYPEDGLAIADSPLCYIDKGDPAKEALFKALQDYLLSPDVQRQILAKGRRVGLLGMETEGADPSVFNPEWGIDTKRVISPIQFPQTEVIRHALELYQTTFRKPSFTVFCLDFSGSMADSGEDDLKSAMKALLDPDQARSHMLQPSGSDIATVIPFNSKPMAEWKAEGADPTQLRSLLAKIEALQADDGTDIYAPVMRGFDLFKAKKDLKSYFPAVILMTDGKSEEGSSFSDLEAHLKRLGLNADIPVYAILFGDASKDQLQRIADLTSGRIFDGGKDLIKAFREAKGYN